MSHLQLAVAEAENHDQSHPGALVAGTVVDDRYEIVDVIGEGGFATVYRARQVHIHRMVALKILEIPRGHEEGEEVFEERFLREARIAASISHPNVVTIHDFGFFGVRRQPYIAMELLQGHDLAVELEIGPMPPRRALRLICDCLDALGAGHHLGIVHKDLKPSNLFLNRPGTRHETLTLLDFGVAIHVQADSRYTLAGQICGTPRYLAPEYIESQTAIPATDVYQMGLVLAELITGRPVVAAPAGINCVMTHLDGVDVPIELRSLDVGRVLRRALARDPADRFRDAHDFRIALDAIVDWTAQRPIVRVGHDRHIAPLPETPDPRKRPTERTKAISRPGSSRAPVADVASAAMDRIAQRNTGLDYFAERGNTVADEVEWPEPAIEAKVGGEKKGQAKDRECAAVAQPETVVQRPASAVVTFVPVVVGMVALLVASAAAHHALTGDEGSEDEVDAGIFAIPIVEPDAEVLGESGGVAAAGGEVDRGEPDPPTEAQPPDDEPDELPAVVVNQNAVLEALAKKRGSFDRCFKRAARRQPKLAGSLTFKVKTNARGRVEYARVLSHTFERDDIGKCVAGHVKRLRVPMKDKRGVTVIETLSFPHEGDRGGTLE